MKAFITGGSGFVGSHLCQHLMACGDEVIAPTSESFDIRVSEQVRSSLAGCNPDVIYHLAGVAFVPECEANFGAALETNVLGTENILKCAREVTPRAAVVIISSGEVYGIVSPEDLPSKESDRLSPINNYSLSKLFCEQMARRAQDVYGQRAIIVRPFNHIGPGQSSRFAIASFAQQLANMKQQKSSAVLRVGNLTAKRDLTDVRDIVRGYRLAALKGNGIYNLCSGLARPISEILDVLIKISGLDVSIEVDPSRLRASENPESRGSFAKAKKELGWEPAIPLEVSLQDTFNSFDAQ